MSDIVGASYPTLIDVGKSLGPKDAVQDIIELLSQSNPILLDMPVLECNDGTKHKTTIRTGLPRATWRRLYQGIQPSKSTRKQVQDTTGFLEAWSEIDAELVKIAPDAARFRLQEAKGHLEGMNNTMAETIFYGDTRVHEERFMGLAPRFSSLGAENASQIIDAGGTGNDLTSIWFVGWGENTVHGLYPRGTKAGLDREDKGKLVVDAPDGGGKYEAYIEKFVWHMGLSVRDWRYVVRIANVSTEALKAGKLDLYGLLRQAYYRFEWRKIKTGRPAVYANADVMQALDALATNAGTADNFVRLTPKDVAGQEVLTYRSIPIRESDSILATEERVA